MSLVVLVVSILNNDNSLTLLQTVLCPVRSTPSSRISLLLLPSRRTRLVLLLLLPSFRPSEGPCSICRGTLAAPFPVITLPVQSAAVPPAPALAAASGCLAPLRRCSRSPIPRTCLLLGVCTLSVQPLLLHGVQLSGLSLPLASWSIVVPRDRAKPSYKA